MWARIWTGCRGPGILCPWKWTGRRCPEGVRGSRCAEIDSDHRHGREYEGTVVVHQTTVPKSFELQFEEGPEKGNTNFGIYELDGDTWKICLATRGSVRPTEFAAPPGTGIALETLRRATAVEADAPVATDGIGRAGGRAGSRTGRANGRRFPWCATGRRCLSRCSNTASGRRRRTKSRSSSAHRCCQGEVRGGPFADAHDDGLRSVRTAGAARHLDTGRQAADHVFWRARAAAAQANLSSMSGRRQNARGVDSSWQMNRPRRAYRYRSRRTSKKS